MRFVKYDLPVLLWALLIFIGSSISSVEVSKDGLVDFLSHKAAHLVEYAVLSFLLYRALIREQKIWDGKKVLISILLAVLYAASDEIHQSFSPGRSSRGRDVFIDLLGSLLGVVLWKFLPRVKRRHFL